MFKNDKINDIAFAIACLTGGPWLFGELLLLFAKEETYYSCPGCEADIKYHARSCPDCHVYLKWPSVKNEKDDQC
jgi:hypothetical protein